MIKIYGPPFSQRVQKALMSASAVGLEFESVPVNLFEGENREGWYVALHPASKVPVIDDDGFVLFESNAIMKYLCRKAGSALYPPDVEGQARVDQWCDFVTLHIDIHVSSLAYNKIIAPKIGVPVDEFALEERPAFLDRFLTVIDKQLSNFRYLAGSELTIADIGLLASMGVLDQVDFSIEKWGHIVRWREELRAQAFYRRVMELQQDVAAAGP